MTTCYVAGSTKEVERVRRVQDLVRERGMTITFDWTGSEGEIQRTWVGIRDRGAAIAEKEVAAAKCDVFILVTPAARGLGCFVEFGIALGHGATCIVIPSPDLSRDSVFFCHPSVRIVRAWAELDRVLGDLA